MCDDRLETAVKGIFAAGDAAEFYDPIADMNYRMGTWNNAGAHGKVVAANMAGGDVRYHDVPEYSSKIFTEQTITQFGLSPEYRNDLDDGAQHRARRRSGIARCGSARTISSAAS